MAAEMELQMVAQKGTILADYWDVSLAALMGVEKVVQLGFGQVVHWAFGLVVQRVALKDVEWAERFETHTVVGLDSERVLTEADRMDKK